MLLTSVSSSWEAEFVGRAGRDWVLEEAVKKCGGRWESPVRLGICGVGVISKSLNSIWGGIGAKKWGEQEVHGFRRPGACQGLPLSVAPGMPGEEGQTTGNQS